MAARERRQEDRERLAQHVLREAPPCPSLTPRPTWADLEQRIHDISAEAKRIAETAANDIKGWTSERRRKVKGQLEEAQRAKAELEDPSKEPRTTAEYAKTVQSFAEQITELSASLRFERSTYDLLGEVWQLWRGGRGRGWVKTLSYRPSIRIG